MKKQSFPLALLGRMSASERAIGRYMRAPDGHGTAFDRVKSIDDLAKALGDYQGDVKSALDGLNAKTAENSALLDDMAQKMVRDDRRGGSSDQLQSIGAQFVAQDGLKAFADAKARSDRFAFEVKATIMSATTNAPGSVGAGIDPLRPIQVMPLPQRRPVVRDLLTVIPVETGSIEVVKIKGRNNNAAPVAEGALKPQSDLQLELETVNARVIAHHMKASRQVLEDMPQLQGLIDAELLDGLALIEDTQLLSGDNTGQNLNGLIPNATAFAAPVPIAGATAIDIIGQALLQCALAEFPATGIVMHPADWTLITHLKDGQGKYLLGDPGSAIPQRLFGLPVVTTQAMSVDKFLVGDFRRAATLYDRWAARVEVETVNDDFIRNLVTILAEERLALHIKYAKALVYGDFGRVP